MNYLKAFFLLSVFAFTLNTVTAQKTNKKTDKSTTQQRLEQSSSVSAKEPAFKWIYSVLLVTDHGGKFEIKPGEGRSKISQQLERQSQEIMKRIESSGEEVRSEGDLINLLSNMKMELISVVAIPESGGRTMKYYLRTPAAE